MHYTQCTDVNTGPSENRRLCVGYMVVVVFSDDGGVVVFSDGGGMVMEVVFSDGGGVVVEEEEVVFSDEGGVVVEELMEELVSSDGGDGI